MHNQKPFDLMMRQRVLIRMPQKMLYRRLNQLQDLGMIRVERKRGKSPRITVLRTEEKNNAPRKLERGEDLTTAQVGD